MGLNANVGGTPRTIINPECNVGGTWHNINQAYVNVGGVWHNSWNRGMYLITNGTQNVSWSMNSSNYLNISYVQNSDSYEIDAVAYASGGYFNYATTQLNIGNWTKLNVDWEIISNDGSTCTTYVDIMSGSTILAYTYFNSAGLSRTTTSVSLSSVVSGNVWVKLGPSSGGAPTMNRRYLLHNVWFSN